MIEGPGAKTRSGGTGESIATSLEGYGVRSMTAPLRRVLLRRPSTNGDWASAGWDRPDPDLLLRQHDALCRLLDDLACGVEVAEALEGQVDACYVHDPVVVTGRGAVLLRMAKPVRRDEPRHAAEDLGRLDVPVVARLGGTARADGGDKFWLDRNTLALGAGYRTNAEGRRQLAEILAREGVTVEAYDLPHHRGPGDVLHFMSFVSAVADDLCVIYEPLAPVRFLQDLRERGVRWIAVEADEYERLGSNVLAVRPGVVVMAEGAPRVRRALERAGCEVHVYEGSEISHKGVGGPTCLTAPLLRAEEGRG